MLHTPVSRCTTPAHSTSRALASCSRTKKPPKPSAARTAKPTPPASLVLLAFGSSCAREARTMPGQCQHHAHALQGSGMFAAHQQSEQHGHHRAGGRNRGDNTDRADGHAAIRGWRCRSGRETLPATANAAEGPSSCGGPCSMASGSSMSSPTVCETSSTDGQRQGAAVEPAQKIRNTPRDACGQSQQDGEHVPQDYPAAARARSTHTTNGRSRSVEAACTFIAGDR